MRNRRYPSRRKTPMTLDLRPPIAPMEALPVDAIPTGPEWQYEPKWDGFRCLAFRDGSDVKLQSKAGRPLNRYFPEMVEALGALKARAFVLDGEYRPGERTAMLKVKNYRSADCVVGGFRYGADGKRVGSLLLGLYDEDGLLHHVGFTSGIRASERKALTQKLERLIAPPGFTGNAPGGPSRWASERSGEWKPLKPKLVVEVRCPHFSGGRFRHGTRLLRWRPDKAPRQCTMDQIRRGGGNVLRLL